MTVRIEIGDGIAGALALPPGGAALVLTDPPWGATAAAWDRPLDWRAWWAAIDHALTPNGVAVVFANLRLALDIVPIASRPFAYDLVWRKNRKSGHLNANKAPLRAHELVLVFGAALSAYTPQFTDGHAPMSAGTRWTKSELYGREMVTTIKAGTTRRYASSVLDFKCVANDSKQRLHSTQKPIELQRWIVRAFTKPGDLVIDLTCGSGSSMHAVDDEGRNGIGWEIVPATGEKARAWLATRARAA